MGHGSTKDSLVGLFVGEKQEQGATTTLGLDAQHGDFVRPSSGWPAQDIGVQPLGSLWVADSSSKTPIPTGLGQLAQQQVQTGKSFPDLRPCPTALPIDPDDGSRLCGQLLSPVLHSLLRHFDIGWFDKRIGEADSGRATLWVRKEMTLVFILHKGRLCLEVGETAK